ncbi:glycosyltransferase family 4 protein [Undibacterium terreum]|uniref:Glycoside hydrolase n=1 Tax=Undibacterium terreum TaxID=1224302 RepID=A0A916XLH4_9BURK|nr:glycosyltransferase family 4 protein [Undibacterium terreum]GGC83873.1 glycoside hydrolase [Undibacterium terreum]
MALADQPRILLVTRNLPPLIGGMEKLNHHIFLELGKRYAMAVAGPEGCASYLNAEAATVATFPTAPKSAFVMGSIRAAWQMGMSFRPDLILCGSGATAPAGFLIARRLGIPLITYLHGLDIVTSHVLYKSIFLPAIRASTTLITNSSNTARLALAHSIDARRLHILHPGVEMDVPEDIEPAAFRQAIEAGDRPILLSVGRLTERKGLYQFIVNCMPDLVRQQPDILLLIVGGEATDALSAKQGIGIQLTETIQQMNLASHVKLLGRIDDARLSQAYSASQLLLFPVLDLPGDVEGFGMVAVEAAAHGLPTVGFAAGGVPDAIAEGVSGYLVPPNDYQQMSKTILRYLSGESQISKDSCKQFANAFSWASFGEKLSNIVSPLLKPNDLLPITEHP